LQNLKISLMKSKDIASAEEVEQEVKRVKFNITMLEGVVQVTPKDTLKDGLVLHYDFEKNKGGKVADKSGNGNDGVVHGATWKPFSGGRKGVVEFNSKNDFIGIGKEDIKKEWTVVILVKLNPSLSGVSRILDSETGSLLLRQNCSSYIRYGDNEYRFSYAIPKNKWTYIVFRSDGKSIHFYADSKKIWSNHDTISCPMSFIGNGNNKWKHSFEGYIDHIKIWARPLSDEEIILSCKK